MALKQKVIFYTVLATLIVACGAPFKELTYTNSSRLDFEGTYKNYCDTSKTKNYRKIELWKNFDRKTEFIDSNYEIQLSLQGDKRLLAKLFLKDSLIEEETIKGKIKEDSCFYARRKFYIVPFIPLIYGYSHHRVRYYAENNDLIYEVSHSGGAGTLIMAAEHKETYKLVYNRSNR